MPQEKKWFRVKRSLQYVKLLLVCASDYLCFHYFLLHLLCICDHNSWQKPKACESIFHNEEKMLICSGHLQDNHLTKKKGSVLYWFSCLRIGFVYLNQWISFPILAVKWSHKEILPDANPRMSWGSAWSKVNK